MGGRVPTRARLTTFPFFFPWILGLGLFPFFLSSPSSQEGHGSLVLFRIRYLGSPHLFPPPAAQESPLWFLLACFAIRSSPFARRIRLGAETFSSSFLFCPSSGGRVGFFPPQSGGKEMPPSVPRKEDLITAITIPPLRGRSLCWR